MRPGFVIAGIDELVIAILLGHRSTFDPVSGSLHTPGSNVTRLYTRVYESAMRAAVAVFDKIRKEIDPKPEPSPPDFDSEIESVEHPTSLSHWNGKGRLVAHTGFEPVLPP